MRESANYGKRTLVVDAKTACHCCKCAAVMIEYREMESAIEAERKADGGVGGRFALCVRVESAIMSRKCRLGNGASSHSDER